MYHNNPKYKLVWDIEEAVTPTAGGSPMTIRPSFDLPVLAADRSAACKHRGDKVRDAACKCPGKAVYACALHAECTLRDTGETVYNCGECPDYTAPTATEPQALAVTTVTTLAGDTPEALAAWRSALEAGLAAGTAWVLATPPGVHTSGALGWNLANWEPLRSGVLELGLLGEVSGKTNRTGPAWAAGRVADVTSDGTSLLLRRDVVDRVVKGWVKGDHPGEDGEARVRRLAGVQTVYAHVPPLTARAPVGDWRVEASDVTATALVRPKPKTKYPSSRTSPEAVLAQMGNSEEATAKWPRGWQRWSHVRAAMKKDFEDEVKADRGQPPDWLTGRGLVTVVQDDRPAVEQGFSYFDLAYVSVWVARRIGCQLPAEWWHAAEKAPDPRWAEVAAQLGVTLVAAGGDGAPRLRCRSGWALKSYAWLHTRFREFVHMDADSIPARPPEALLDDPAYRSVGAMWWPDLYHDKGHEWVSEKAWEFFMGADRTQVRRHRSVVACQGGHHVFDKANAGVWKALHLVRLMNEYADFYHAADAFGLHGEKDLTTIAWQKLKLPYALPTRPTEWVPPALYEYDFGGRLAWVHFCQGKKQVADGDLPKGLPHAAHVTAALASLRAAKEKVGLS